MGCPAPGHRPRHGASTPHRARAPPHPRRCRGERVAHRRTCGRRPHRRRLRRRAAPQLAARVMHYTSGTTGVPKGCGRTSAPGRPQRGGRTRWGIGASPLTTSRWCIPRCATRRRSGSQWDAVGGRLRGVGGSILADQHRFGAYRSAPDNGVHRPEPAPATARPGPAAFSVPPTGACRIRVPPAVKARTPHGPARSGPGSSTARRRVSSPRVAERSGRSGPEPWDGASGPNVVNR